jgi:hypothetical protein
MVRLRLSRLMVAVLIAAAPHRLHGQPLPSPSAGWHLVYGVDSMGVRTFGDKAELLSALRAGLPVRVGWGTTSKLKDGTTGGVEHVAEAAFVTIHQGEVFAQLPPLIPQNATAGEPSISFRIRGDFSHDTHWYLMLDTTGRLLGFSTDRRPQTIRTATYWYVEGTHRDGPARLY